MAEEDRRVTNMLIKRFDRLEDSFSKQFEKQGDKIDRIRDELYGLKEQFKTQNGRVNRNEAQIKALRESLGNKDDRLEALETEHIEEEAVEQHKAHQWKMVRWFAENFDNIIAIGAACVALLIAVIK